MLARWLAGQGHEAKHVADLGLADADDRTIWRRARDLSFILVTKDEDFALLWSLDPEGPAVVWIRLGNTRKKDLLRWLERLLPATLEALERGDSLIELS